MIDYGDEHKDYDTIVTNGRYAGRIYYCKKPFKLEGLRFYLGGDVDDWAYFGGAPELPRDILQDYITEYVVKERQFLIEQIVRQKQDLNLVIYDAGDGTWEIMQRKQPQGGGASASTGLPDL